MPGTTRRQTLQFIASTAVLAQLGACGQGPAPAKGAVIRTLFRDFAPDELAGGATLFHEHLSIQEGFMDRFLAATNAVRAAQGEPPTEFPPELMSPPGPDPMRDVSLMTEELRAAKSAGIACIVDAGLEGMGTDLAFIREVARQSGLPVVKGAGFYNEPFYPPEIATLGEEQIVERLIRQADEYPAGAFGEIGSWDEISAVERKVFRAVGKAHLATNLPIFTHTGIPGKSALEQLDIFEDAGVDPRRVAIGHLGNLEDPALYVHKTLCRRGAFVCFDRQGGGDSADAPVVPMVKGLVDAGFADQVLVSGDAFRNYARPLTAFVPRLKAAGISEQVLHQITVDNPRRFLAFVPKRPRR